MMRARSWILAGLIAAGALGGCSCNDDTVGAGDGGLCASGLKACRIDDDCPERHVCHKDPASGESCCARTYRSCADDSQCCPGQICTADGRCVDKFDECTVASDCGETPDRVCQAWTDPALGTSQRCSYARCGEDGSCPEGQACFAHVCVVQAPCGGSCPAGTACVPQAAGGGRCHPYGDRCALEPKAGHLVVFTDPDSVFDVCLMSDLACEYAELPPLTTADLGRHASAALAGERLVVAQYDGTYGDLVVSDHDLTGRRLRSVWVDGVPATGALVAGPSGPRGGIIEPGADVGLYTSTAAGADGTVYVAYYDRTSGDLRLAERSPSGSWSSHVVDGAGADVGLYPSLVIDPAGNPAVAYFQRASAEATDVSCPAAPADTSKSLLTGVRLARAAGPHPKPSDWTIEQVDCAARPPPPCFGCEGGQVCVVDPEVSGATLCKATGSGCAPVCPTGEVCVAGNTCAPQASPTELLSVPWGKGLFPSLAFKSEVPVVAYYDRTRGNLVAAQRNSASGAWEPTIIDGEDAQGADTGHVGAYPSLAVDGSGTLLVAYHDLTRRGLRFWSGGKLAPFAQQRTPPATAFIDTGIADARADGPAWVGANASLALAPGGLYVAYQNTTAADLRLSSKTSTGWKLQKEWTEGALGFYSHAVALPSGLAIVHTRMHAKISGGRPVPDHQVRVEIFNP